MSFQVDEAGEDRSLTLWESAAFCPQCAEKGELRTPAEWTRPSGGVPGSETMCWICCWSPAVSLPYPGLHLPPRHQVMDGVDPQQQTYLLASAHTWNMKETFLKFKTSLIQIFSPVTVEPARM